MAKGALPLGTYWIDAACPRCGEVSPAIIVLSARLTADTSGDASIKVRAATKAVDHLCGQTAIKMAQRDGLLFGEPEPDDRHERGGRA